MERGMEIERTSEAWSKNLQTLELAALSKFDEALNWGIMENGNTGKREIG
jgi:hypothetical protein